MSDDSAKLQLNPMGNFDSSQWTNPYSSYYGKALPWPSSYFGTPNNALGQPIAPPTPGMTLNSSPVQQQAAAPTGISPYTIAKGNPAIDAGNMSAGLMALNSMIPNGPNSYQAGPGTPPGYWEAQAAARGGAGAGGGNTGAVAAAAPNNWQTTLAQLANPGKVTTPGATIPAAPTSGGQPSPGVLQNFLQNWQPASSGAGSGFTQNFNSILRGLQAKGS